MGDQRHAVAAGLDRVVGKLRNGEGSYDFVVGPAVRIVGYAGQAGTRKPEPSSAARLSLGNAEVWVPVPDEPGDAARGDAPVYLYGGAEYVLPHIRIFAAGDTQRYLTLADWLHAAFTVWRFPRSGRGTDRVTIVEQMAAVGSLQVEQVAEVIAEIVRYALLGSRPGDEYRPAIRVLGLRLPRRRMPVWLRKIGGGTKLARAVARRTVLTVSMGDDGLPRPSRAGRHRIDPTEEHDRGLDPVHTPEDKEKIRFVGYIGMGVGVREGKLVPPPGTGACLSSSTARVPFARFDAPRRLLMAANMQVQSMPLAKSELPVVRVPESGEDPPGVNLRVAFMGWRGWNHEDAWILSESAAAKLTACPEIVHTIPISAVECHPTIRVAVGQKVRRGEPLLTRFLSPTLLAPEMDGLIGLSPLECDFARLALPADAGVEARVAGEVVAVESWNLAPDTVCPVGRTSAATAARFRAVVQVRVRRDLPLREGDKLANRHGHKGVIGRILPDREMPCWQGEPLEALIDPISVLSRSNWGQLMEALAGAVVSSGGICDPHASREELLVQFHEKFPADAAAAPGQVMLTPPATGCGWMSGPRRTMAGLQFVMRLPKHAADLLSADVPRGGPVARRVRARLGEQGVWAGWAHGIGLVPQERTLSDGANALSGLLGAAGIEFTNQPDPKQLVLRRLPVSEPNAAGDEPWSVEEDRTALLERVRLKGGRLLLGRPLRDVYLPGRDELVEMAWVCIPPPEVRPPEPGLDGLDRDHELTRLSLEVIRRAVERQQGRRYRGKSSCESSELDRRCRQAIGQLARAAFVAAVGTSGQGYKDSVVGNLLRRPRSARSGRAVAAPAGLGEAGMELALDEVGLPAAVAAAAFHDPNITTDADLVRDGGERPWVWIKRDPILHRWGLLRLRARVVPGHAIRLPASLLRPLGADFDGDAVAVFYDLPLAGEPPGSPSAIGWDETLKRGVFFPSKQYVYGLELLAKNPSRRSQLDEELTSRGAPVWPEGDTLKAINNWVAAASQASERIGEWWQAVERHALLALADDPGMGLSLLAPDALGRLGVIRCGAAKQELFGPDAFAPGSEAYHAYAGESLGAFGGGPGTVGRDMIREVMVASAGEIGRFGNVPRRFIYSARTLDKEFVRAVHALSEQAIQRMLSVKADAACLKYKDYSKLVLKPLLKGEEPKYEELPGALGELVGSPEMRRVCRRISEGIAAEPDSWARWLSRPSKLSRLLAGGGDIGMPAEDPRVRVFFT
jgi:hypothetical protein